MENQIVPMLEKQIDQAKDVPAIQARIQQHLVETKQHRSRMEQRLHAYGKSPSAVKGAMSTIMGTTAGMLQGAQADTLAMNARNAYVTGHLEIAAYTMLMATATAHGDQDTVLAAEQNLRDEVAMQQWRAQHTAEAALLSLQQDGIDIPDRAWQFARQMETMAHPAEDLAQKNAALETGTVKTTTS